MTFSFDPLDGYRNTTSFPTTPVSETEFRNSLMTLLDQIKDYLNGTVDAQLADIVTNISQFPRLSGETDDTERFQRAVSYLSSLGGGELLLKAETYTLGKITIPDNVRIRGRVSKDAWTGANITLLTFNGTGNFICIESYHDKRSALSTMNLVTTTMPGRNSPTTAIRIKRSTNNWGASAVIEQVSIFGFGTGIAHQMTFRSLVNECSIWDCGVGISYNAKVEGSGQDPTTSFGNLNVVERTNIVECNIGVVLASDMVNEFRNTNIEKCYIAIHTYRNTGGYFPPQQHVFNDCWFEANGWASATDKINNTNPRYLVCNSDINSSFEALGTNVAELPKFTNCRNDSNVSPQIPSDNIQYQTFNIRNESKTRNYYTDENIRDFYNKPLHRMERIVVGDDLTWRELFNVTNKGVTANLAFNLGETTGAYTSTPGYTIQTLTIPYSDIVNPEVAGESNYISSISLLSVTVVHSDGGVCTAMFIINDYHQRNVLNIAQLGITVEAYTGLLTGNKISIVNKTMNSVTNIKTFDVQVEGKLIISISAKLTFLPNGLLVGN